MVQEGVQASQRTAGGALAILAVGALVASLWCGEDVRAQRGRAARPDPFASREACLESRPPRREAGVARIATWNVRWFPDGSPDDTVHPTDVEWLACAIAALRVDAIALQEIVLHERGRRALAELIAALDRRTGGRWEHRDDGCPPESQHLVVLVDRARARIDRVEIISALHPHGDACAHRLRPGLAVSLTFDGGLDLTMLTLHLDSGTTARDHGNRRASMAALPRAIAPSLAADGDLVLLGDLNSMGCRGCAPPTDVAAENAALEAELAAAGMVRVAPTQPCSEYAGSQPSGLDHVAITRTTTELAEGARAEVSGACASLRCGRLPRGPDPASLTRLSDHCPIVLELADADRDP